MSSSDKQATDNTDAKTNSPAAESASSEETAAGNDVELKIERLAGVLEEKIAAHGEHHLECAPAYVEYAAALLSKAQSEGDPFGGAAPHKKGEAEGGGSSSAPAPEEEEDDEEGEEGEGEGEAGESDDLELSFQCFEVARLIYEKQGASHELPLADVLESLGEVAMENEMWEDAVAELERSVAIKSRLLPAADRQLAQLHFQLATATVAQGEKARHDADAPPPPEEPEASDAPRLPTAAECHALAARCQEAAIVHYQRAADVLELRLTSLRPAGTNGKAKVVEGEAGGEEAELAEILAEVRAKIEEQQAAPTSGTAIAGAVAGAGPEAAAGGGGAPTESVEGVTTIGFGAPEGKTTIGFGAPEGVTTIGFGGGDSGGFAAPSTASLPVTNLGVVGKGSDGKKRIRLS